MPHTDSAKKRLRQNERRNLQNRSVKRDLRTHIKKVLQAVKDGKPQEAQDFLRLVYKKLDKCAVRRYLHPNTAHRYKSRLTKRVNAGAAPKAEATA